MSSEGIIKTYVQHEGKWFFVSTIERDSSAAAAPDLRYFETIVWEYDIAINERRELLGTFGAGRGNIHTHQRVVLELFLNGKVPEE